jgi:hypothetical protein
MNCIYEHSHSHTKVLVVHPLVICCIHQVTNNQTQHFTPPHCYPNRKTQKYKMFTTCTHIAHNYLQLAYKNLQSVHTLLTTIYNLRTKIYSLFTHCSQPTYNLPTNSIHIACTLNTSYLHTSFLYDLIRFQPDSM